MIGPLKFLSDEVALYIYKSAISSYMVNVVVMSGLVLPAVTWTYCISHINGYIGLLATLGPLVHRLNVASVSRFYLYYFGRCSSELVELVLPPCSHTKSTHYTNSSHNFLLLFLVAIRMCMSTVSFFAQLVSRISFVLKGFL